jgi:glycerophosphoryl diester phosphodiesterase
MPSHVVIYGGAGFLKNVQALNPALKIMPEAGGAAMLERLVADLHLKVAAFDAGDFKDDAIAVAKRAGVDIYVDRLGPADNPAAWQDAVDRGAAGIQTDRPGELVAYLRSHKLHGPN